jgi:hypothetical protein
MWFQCWNFTPFTRDEKSTKWNINTCMVGKSCTNLWDKILIIMISWICLNKKLYMLFDLLEILSIIHVYTMHVDTVYATCWQNLWHSSMIDWLFRVLRPTQQFFTYITGEGLQNLGLCSAIRAFEQGRIFIVPHLLWHGALVFPVSSEGPPQSVAFYDTHGYVEELFELDPHGVMALW